MTKPLWAPWRLDYIKSADEQEGCFICAAPGLDPDESLLVHRGERVLVLLNRYPYSAGHLLVAPLRHVGGFGELDDAEALETHRLAERGVRALEAAYGAQGFNLGWNLGRVAGAGLPGHVHLHVVPRWSGDTNFMPVLADVKVVPEHLLVTRRQLAAAFAAA